ncbi:hypothetical protein HQ865_02440 [Mucilaginibacter mali]|uniref:Uncharacterized protein n=1 Tax=Mucilaginibacter mali TaxID=2740462 RepID=A0A7D4UKN6_9SPHI|nr:hypothetical protein [Mucilaginibacter mali]QKJ28661.1 hypothetical protein HQ865_02440 [Mucilaginibacter mali]
MRQLLFCLMFLFPVLALGQRKLPPPLPGPPTKADDECADKANQCLNSHKYNARQRLAFYPFNIACKIRLISFEYNNDPRSVIIGEKAIPENNTNQEPIITPVKSGEFAIDYSRIIEFKDLSQKAIDELTDIFFNVGFTPIKCNVYIGSTGAKCYEPRNAILFIDKNGKTVQYVELCFGCQRYYLSSSKIKNTAYCEQKFNMIRTFFASEGVVYGTNKER